MQATCRVALVGCGFWGKNLARNFHQLGALTCISDLNPGTAASAATQYGVPAVSFEAAIADPAVNAVVLATPAETHGRLVLDALRAGKDVFVEKPLALDLQEARRICDVAESHGRVLMVGHLLQYHTAFLKLKEIVRNGDLGRLQYIYSNRLNLGRFRREENILWSFAPHDISMILSLVGEMPMRVAATGAAYLHAQIADVTTTNLVFANGVNAHVFVSWLHPFKEQKLVVVGDRGMAVFDDRLDWPQKLQLFSHVVEWKGGLPVPLAAPATPVAIEPQEPLARECQTFLDCVAQRKSPPTDGREGLRVLEVLAAAEHSMRGGEPSTPLSGWEACPKDYFAHATAVIDDGATVGAGTKIWHFSHVLPGTVIGRDCIVGQNAMIGPQVHIGDRCKIQNNVSLYKGVTLEDGVFCGPSCVFTNVMTPRAAIERKDEFLPTLVKRGTTIGANATIICGVTLGEYCFVAAGAVVNRDVAPFALVAGTPARRIGWVSRAGERLGPDLVCPRTGAAYRTVGQDRLEEIAPR